MARLDSCCTLQPRKVVGTNTNSEQIRLRDAHIVITIIICSPRLFHICSGDLRLYQHSPLITALHCTALHLDSSPIVNTPRLAVLITDWPQIDWLRTKAILTSASLH